jgi:hypothetical protein
MQQIPRRRAPLIPSTDQGGGKRRLKIKKPRSAPRGFLLPALRSCCVPCTEEGGSTPLAYSSRNRSQANGCKKKFRDCLMRAELLAERHMGAEGVAWSLSNPGAIGFGLRARRQSTMEPAARFPELNPDHSGPARSSFGTTERSVFAAEIAARFQITRYV